MPEPPLTNNTILPTLPGTAANRAGQQIWPYTDDIEGVYSRVVAMMTDGASMHWVSKKYRGFTVRRVNVVRVAATGNIFAYHQHREPGALDWNTVNDKHHIGRRL